MIKTVAFPRLFPEHGKYTLSIDAIKCLATEINWLFRTSRGKNSGWLIGLFRTRILK